MHSIILQDKSNITYNKLIIKRQNNVTLSKARNWSQSPKIGQVAGKWDINYLNINHLNILPQTDLSLQIWEVPEYYQEGLAAMA